jgi:hypothetical protein
MSDDPTHGDRPGDPDGPGAAAEHEQFAPDVAGYVLGGLSLDEQHAFEAHLATCSTCRDELDQLDPVPVLLDLSAGPTPAPARQPDQPARPAVGAAPEVASPMSAVPEVLAPPTSPRRRRRRVAAGSLAALAVAAAFVIGLMVATPHEPGYTQAVALHPAVSTTGAEPTAQGTVAVRPVDHGTEVRLSVRGLPTTPGTYYECLWWSADAVRSAGTFRVTSGGATQVELTTAAELRPGWRLAILEHPSGRSTPVTVLQTSA